MKARTLAGILILCAQSCWAADPTAVGFLKEHEGLRLKAYTDAGHLSIGYGHQLKDGESKSITAERAEELLVSDVEVREKVVDAAVKVATTPNQRAALVSFAYNVGNGNFLKSTLLKKLNAGDVEGVKGEFGKWVRSEGKVMPGLVKRRADEAELFGS